MCLTRLPEGVNSTIPRNALRKKRQRRRHANENTLEQNASIGEHTHRATNCIPPAEVALNLAVGHFERK